MSIWSQLVGTKEDSGCGKYVLRSILVLSAQGGVVTFIHLS